MNTYIIHICARAVRWPAPPPPRHDIFFLNNWGWPAWRGGYSNNSGHLITRGGGYPDSMVIIITDSLLVIIDYYGTIHKSQPVPAGEADGTDTNSLIEVTQRMAPEVSSASVASYAEKSELFTYVQMADLHPSNNQYFDQCRYYLIWIVSSDSVGLATVLHCLLF